MKTVPWAIKIIYLNIAELKINGLQLNLSSKRWTQLLFFADLFKIHDRKQLFAYITSIHLTALNQFTHFQSFHF